jgi:hydrogenase expression/formation protein HypE
MEPTQDLGFQCPLPVADHARILLAHGGGGRLMHQLLEQIFLPAFQNPHLAARHDGATLTLGKARLAYTTDSYVVRPLVFPGGDIGSLAVNGTVNDLAMCGARPAFLSAGLILEEGLLLETLTRIVQSMRQAALSAGVQLVTGDTKVVERGKGDGIYINTSGIGLLEHELTIAPSSVRPGDVIVLNGDIGRHGMAIMAVREGLQLESTIESDCAALAMPILALLANGLEIHCLRDLTRGGLASALVEIAEASALHLQIAENAIPVREDVQGLCELLGFDPFYVANEGRFITILPASQADQALAILRDHSPDSNACLVGHIDNANAGLVTLRSRIGTTRIIDMLSGEQLPRIC